MIESIITDYLRANRRLVIPELGAFLKKDGGETVFVPFLNKDDGILTGLVGQTYGTSSVEAEGIIAQYVENVRDSINKRGVYLIFPLGSLKADPNGLLFLDTKDLNPQAAEQKAVVEEQVAVPSEPATEETIQPEKQEPAEEVIQPIVSIPEPEPEPEPTPEPEIKQQEMPVREELSKQEAPQIVAETVDAPKTLNDLIRERQEQQDAVQEPGVSQVRKPVGEVAAAIPPEATVQRNRPEPSPRTRYVEPKSGTQSKPQPRPQQRQAIDPAKKEKRGDMVLIIAVIVAIIAIVAMIYAYAVVDLPLFSLQ